MEYIHAAHTFPPIYDAHSQILILGSFPSVKSREQQFYYGHPKNRFWDVLAEIFEENPPKQIEEKQNFLLRHKIALWDVIESCDIAGSSDSSIRNVVVNDMGRIIETAPIQAIYANGDKAYQLFVKYCSRDDWPQIKKLPSTSPANAAWSLERLIAAWGDELQQQ